ncbi:MAG TPA: hypothetical protein VF290_19230 [Pyrinomonadaceae bacterium]
MDTNKQRVTYLQKILDQLGSTIQEKNREDEYIGMLEQLKQGKLKLEPISEEEWDLMLPKEQDKHLLVYYHSTRNELHLMKLAAKTQSKIGKLKDWLESPWVKVGLTAVTLTQLAVKLVEAAHHAGLFFQEEDDDERIV